MEGTMFQPHQATELSRFVYVALHLDARKARTRETMLDSCSSRIRVDGKEISITEVKSSR